MTTVLDVLKFPLWGSRLIEASAGTGKTWTIAALTLRLVLGHGHPGSAFQRALLPAEILVMTFTRAATRELSGRIRQRLTHAALCFRGDAEPDGADSFLHGLLADHPAGPEREQAAWRLACAAEQMDDAAVHTIDAWCQRMLREHAFDSGCLFDEELASDDGAMLLQAAHDVWRQQVYPLNGAPLSAALGVWPDANAFAADARRLLRHPLQDSAAAAAGSLGALIERLLEERSASLSALKSGWAEAAEGMRGWLKARLADKDCPFSKHKLQTHHIDNWLDTVAAWAIDPLAGTLELSKTAAARLTPAGMHDAFKDDCRCALPPEFAAFEQLQQALAELPKIDKGLRAFTAARLSQRLAEIKTAAGAFGFDDMLSRLDAALDPAHNGAAAERLRQRILQQTPVALVDEFQDTSPVQARILDRLYRLADNNPENALLLIGDPKQSIYSFRGADIRCYLQARQATEGRHSMLATNHRSTTALVAAVNQLFAQAESSVPGGAFLFCDAHGDGLPFVPVAARGHGERCITSHGELPAMRLELDTQLQDADSLRSGFAARCAEHIVGLLNDPLAGFESADRWRRLRPSDIAVLVRTGKEAALVRRELRRRQVASVYLSDKDSVFASQEARDLWHWLRAVASPRDVRLARAALATGTVGLEFSELLHLAQDDEAFDARSDQLRQLNSLWQGQGVLAMLRHTLHLLDLPARWLAADSAGCSDHDSAADAGGAISAASPASPAADGERRLTNVLHLAELLQAASSRLEGEQALIRWLGQQMADSAAARGDDTVLRLESDADLVQVVTIHKAKGLEYPLVFLPFASAFRTADTRRDDDTPHELAERERLREDLRLLYVALTRACHSVWVGLAALKVGANKVCTWPRSAIGHLMGGDTPVFPEDLPERVWHAAGDCPAIELLAATAASAVPRTRALPRGPRPPLRASAPYAANFDRRWAVGSFSALLRALPMTSIAATSTALVLADEAAAPQGLPAVSEGDDAAPAPPGAMLAATVMAAATAATAAASTAASSAAPWHGFPRGAVPGNFLHDQLEWLASENFDLNSVPVRQQQLLARCERLGWGHRGHDVVAWLRRVLATPLAPLHAALQDLPGSLPEMEFWCPSDTLQALALDAWCRQHILPGLPRPALPERTLRGMLMGFADLVFEHGGRYFVLDHKSNHLGACDADYTTAALAAAMAEHRYDVQAALYLLALHRLLRSRLGGTYKPAQHLGGALYLFLRGIGGPASGCLHVELDAAALDSLDALLVQCSTLCGT